MISGMSTPSIIRCASTVNIRPFFRHDPDEMGRAIFTGVTAELPAPNDGGAQTPRFPRPVGCAGEPRRSGRLRRARSTPKKRPAALLRSDTVHRCTQAVPPGAPGRGDLNGLSGGGARSRRDRKAVCSHSGWFGVPDTGRGAAQTTAGQGAEVVAAQRTARCRAEQSWTLVDRPLGFPRLADEVVQPGH